MRCHGLFAITRALADHIRTHQACHRSVDVHHGTACEVECAFGPQPTCSSCHSFQSGSVSDGVRAVPIPDHVGDGHVAEGEPQSTEQQHGREASAFSESTHDQCARDGRKRGLEGSEGQLRNHHAFAERGSNGVRRDAFEEQLVQASDERVACCEGQGVAVEHPQDVNQRGHHKHLHQHRQHVLAADQAAVEQRQARNGHQNHEHGGHGHPSGIALVGHGCGCRFSSRGRGGRRSSGCCGLGFSSRGGCGLRHDGRAAKQQTQPEGEGGKQFFHDEVFQKGSLCDTIRGLLDRSHRYGCEPLVRGRRQKSCRRRS